MKFSRSILKLLGFFVFMSLAGGVWAHDAAQIDRDSQAALNALYAKTPAAKALGAQAKAIMIFPKITKAGLVVGGLYGEGALIKDGKTMGYFSSTAASIGLQAGVQTYSYAMFFMTDKALAELDKVEGFEIGVGPSIVIVDEGIAKNLTTATLQSDIYAFIFGQKGLMAGIGIQGSKISKIGH